MKNKKINIKTIIIIVLIGIIISMFFIILNIKNNNIVGQEIRKEQLGETTTDNAYVELQTHLSEVNDKEQKLLSFKTKVASAITDMGVKTSNEADADTMASNIRSISAAATEQTGFRCISSGTMAGGTVTVTFEKRPKILLLMYGSQYGEFLWYDTNPDYYTCVFGDIMKEYALGVAPTTMNSSTTNLKYYPRYTEVTDTSVTFVVTHSNFYVSGYSLWAID